MHMHKRIDVQVQTSMACHEMHLHICAACHTRHGGSMGPLSAKPHMHSTRLRMCMPWVSSPVMPCPCPCPCPCA